jgi:hypothetical protein
MSTPRIGPEAQQHLMVSIEIEHAIVVCFRREAARRDMPVTKRWKHMGAGAHLNEWLAYGDGLMIRRRLAMKIAHVNRPEGRGYVQTFAQLMKLDGLEHMDKTSITAVLWLHDEPERMAVLREILDTLNVGQRARLNSPISARQRVEKELKVRQGGTEAQSKTSPITILKQSLVEREHKIAHLEERLAAAERDSSLFDLKKDSAEDIAEAIVANVVEHKVRTLIKAMDARLKKKRAPAG